MLFKYLCDFLLLLSETLYKRITQILNKSEFRIIGKEINNRIFFSYLFGKKFPIIYFPAYNHGLKRRTVKKRNRRKN